LKNQLKGVQDEKVALEAQLKTAQDEKVALETRLKSTGEDKTFLQQENASLKSQLKAMQDEKAALETRLKSMGEDKTFLQQENASLKSQLKAMQNEKAALETRLKSTEEDKTLLQQENASLRNQVAEITRQRDTAVTDREKAVSSLKNTYDNLMKELNKEIKEGQITITQLKDRLSLTMVEKVLFDSGSADIKKDGQKVLDRVGRILKQVKDKEISIEGHTDNVPIGLKLQQKFPTNWELSTTRATNVARYFQEKADLDPKLLIASGFAEYRPVASNDTEEGRTKNRRIEILLTPLSLEKTVK
jgi:chemotaxis protein MotB